VNLAQGANQAENTQAATEIRSSGWNVVQSKRPCRKNESQVVEDKFRAAGL
jgi:hypothetical protein